MTESSDDKRISRRAFHRKAALATASAVLASSCAPAEENPTVPAAKPEDAASDRLADEAAAQVQGGLTDAERKRVREQIRGMADVLKALRQAPVPEGAELSSTWTPLLPSAREDRRKTRTP